MKSFLLFSLSFFLTFLTSAGAQQVLFQGFEGSAADNFAFAATPAKYNNLPAEDVWSDTTATSQITPATGDRQWFMRDLENPSGGGAFAHTLDFGPVDVSAFSANTLTFKYFTNAYDADDSIGYYIAYDNGTDWNNYTALNPNSLAWETVTINVPAGASFSASFGCPPKWRLRLCRLGRCTTLLRPGRPRAANGCKRFHSRF